MEHRHIVQVPGKCGKQAFSFVTTEQAKKMGLEISGSSKRPGSPQEPQRPSKVSRENTPNTGGPRSGLGGRGIAKEVNTSFILTANGSLASMHRATFQIFEMSISPIFSQIMSQML